MNKPVHKFYSDAQDYWSKIPPTIDGMLGGFGHISQVDVQGSRIFLQQLFKSKNPPGRTYAADCGAGIGRISKHLLLNIFDKVDLIEQNPIFLDTARGYLGSKLICKVGNFIPVGLQNFQPETNKYDIVWIQWVLGHLTDAHCIQFFTNCIRSLKVNGMIIVKENITSSEITDIDENDSSITRPIHFLKSLFESSGLDCYRQMKQTSFPKELYNVYMFALKPKVHESEINLEITVSTNTPADSVSKLNTDGELKNDAANLPELVFQNDV